MNTRIFRSTCASLWRDNLCFEGSSTLFSISALYSFSSIIFMRLYANLIRVMQCMNIHARTWGHSQHCVKEFGFGQGINPIDLNNHIIRSQSALVCSVAGLHLRIYMYRYVHTQGCMFTIMKRRKTPASRVSCCIWVMSTHPNIDRYRPQVPPSVMFPHLALLRTSVLSMASAELAS